MVWLAFASMTAAAVLCAVWPLTRRSPARLRASPDVALYREQMAEVDNDVARGMLPASAAEGAKAELGRRLLRAAHGADGQDGLPPHSERRTAVAVAILCALPLLAIGLYLKVGSPSYGDQPLAQRISAGEDLEAAVQKVESHLASHPDDGRGFEILAPIYLKAGRYGQAANAYAQVIRLLGATPERQAAYGQALVMASEGVVTEEARSVFDAALKIEPNLPQARFYLGVAAEQDGDKATARALWEKLLNDAPAGASWAALVRQRVAALDRPAPALDGQPSGPVAAGIAALPAEQRDAAIRGMVAGLAARLAQNGKDLEGWLRLIRAYTVLGDADRAKQALAEARRSVPGEQASLSRLEQLARELGLEG